MRKGQRRFVKCKYCPDKVVELYNSDLRFKGYRKTCEKHHGYRFRKRELNTAYRGGIIYRDGYVLILAPFGHPFYDKRGAARYILQHRLVMESMVGRKLKSEEIVHHLNGIRNDNRPENLCLLPSKKFHETWTYARRLQERIRELELLLRKNGVVV